MTFQSGYRMWSGEQLNGQLAGPTGPTGPTGSAGATGAAGAGASSSAPATATSTGTAGTVAYDSGFLYVCTATNVWKRVAIATW